MALRMHEQREPELREWLPVLPFGRWFDDLARDTEGHRLIKVEEFTEDGVLVVRAEMPGLDPDKDVEITVENGMLHISAQRTEETETSERDFHRREMRYGSFARTVTLPDGIDGDAVAATYKDGILEVRMPMPAEPPKEATRRVPVTRA